MNTKRLQYILVLARELNFTYAAEKLGITQSSMSQCVKKEESEIGTKLFERYGVAVQLTEAGKAYVSAAMKILEIEKNFENNITDITNSSRGTIRIGISPYRGASIMPDIIYRFKQEYPHIKVVLEERVTSALVDGIRGGEFDLCVASLPVRKADLEYRLLPSEEIVLAVPKTMKGVRSELCAGKNLAAIDFSQCSGFPFVTQKEGQAIRMILDDLAVQSGIDVERVVECVNVGTIHAMVYHGVGCAVLPQWCARDGNYASRVNYYSIKQEIDWTNAVFWLRTQTQTRPTKRLIALLEKGERGL